MLGQVLAHLRNYFLHSYETRTFEVSNGSIELPRLRAGQHFCISGSVFNDGVYQYPVSDLKDEVFYGTVFALAIPKSLLDLVKEIEDWQTANGKASASPYQSESFGGYSYTMKSGADGASVSWQSAFADRLNVWRKI